MPTKTAKKSAKKTASKTPAKPATKTATKSAKKTATKSATKTASKSGKLSTAAKDKLPGKTFAFTAKRKEPLENASHVRNALARFNQVKGVTDDEREKAFSNIKKAAKKFGVKVDEKNWKELGDKK